MRLGIDYRLLASRENLVNRGIGRYTQQQLRQVLAVDGENEYLLLCPPGADTSLVLPQIRAATNVAFRFGPATVSPAPDDPYDRRGLLRRAGEYQDWVHSLGVDLYHATAPFVLEQTAPPAWDACPMVATLYDLIPLVFPSEYLSAPGPRQAYAGAARLVRSATRLLAISDGTRDDAVNYLGFARGAVDCATPFADPCFALLDPPAVDAALGALVRRAGLPEQFALTVAALHHTKNLELLFAAYARLSPAFRRAVPLVVACHLDEVGMAHVRRWAATFGVADDTVLTGYVSDDELAALYNRATLVVHPSRYEGFGLPVVEAMQCGAAVVTTTAPSLPEVTAGAAVLVDPDDAVGLAAAIEALSADPATRAAMGERGIAQAATFTPEALACNTLGSYRAAVTGGPPSGDPPRVAVRIPVAPDGVPPGAALGACDVELFVDDADGVVSEDLLDLVAVHHAGAFERCEARRRFDAVARSLGELPPCLPAEDAPVPGFNKLCEVEDFAHPAVVEALDTLALASDAGPWEWAMAMSLRSLAEVRLLGAGRRILSLGPAGVHLGLCLTRDAGEVTLAGPWLAMAERRLGRGLLVDPALVATAPFDRSRLVVRHAHLHRLPFADGSFDAVVACRLLDGPPPAGAAAVLAEAARVVRPGGVVTCSTSVRVHGPAGGAGLPLEGIPGQLIGACGLVPVDPIRTTLSPATVGARRRFAHAFDERQAAGGEAPLTIHRGALLAELHLALRVPEESGAITRPAP